MIRDVTLYTVSCNLACSLRRGWDLFFNRVYIGCSTEILQDKLPEGCYTVQWLEDALQRCGNRCEK